jgi:hypothetical protein
MSLLDETQCLHRLLSILDGLLKGDERQVQGFLYLRSVNVKHFFRSHLAPTPPSPFSPLTVLLGLGDRLRNNSFRNRARTAHWCPGLNIRSPVQTCDATCVTALHASRRYLRHDGNVAQPWRALNLPLRVTLYMFCFFLTTTGVSFVPSMLPSIYGFQH